MDYIFIFAQLFTTFFLIGTFTFGGGYAMLSLIQTQVVSVHAWITESQFTDIVAISQMTPGPIGINAATYVGYDVLSDAGANGLVCVLGSFTATAALVLPSFLIVLLMVKFYEKFMGEGHFKDVMGWVRPSVAGLIGAAAIILIVNTSWQGLVPHFSVIRENFTDWKSWVLLGGAIIASLRFKVGPIPIILAGGLAGMILY